MKQHRMTRQSRRNIQAADYVVVEDVMVSGWTLDGAGSYAIRWEHGGRVGYAQAGDGSIMLYGSPARAHRALERIRPTGETQYALELRSA